MKVIEDRKGSPGTACIKASEYCILKDTRELASGDLKKKRNSFIIGFLLSISLLCFM